MQFMKRCTHCGRHKPLSEFDRNRTKAHGHDNECKPCRRARDRARKFGITFDEYEALLEKQKHVCAICGRPEQKRRLAVDHNHVTGKVRGLLCGRCNRALGFLLDSPLNVLRGVVYLMEHNEENTAD